MKYDRLLSMTGNLSCVSLECVVQMIARSEHVPRCMSSIVWFRGVAAPYMYFSARRV